MNTYKEDSSKEKLSHDIYIWIGDESTQDEYGTAAYKMVELDNKLGGTAVQHRETQEKESEKFLGYFHNKITYLDGGIESGFRHVEPSNANPQLFHIKGHVKAGTIRMTQEPCRRDAMNSGDVFVLNAGEGSCWLWIGKESNKDEKAKGMDVAKAFCTKGSVKVLDEGVNDGLEEVGEFWKYVKREVSVLGPIKRKVDIRKADDMDDRGRSYVPTLFRIPEKLGGKLSKVATSTMTPTGPTNEKRPKILRSLLRKDNAYILDTGFHVYVWMGSGTRPNTRSLALHHAEIYFNTQKRPILPVTILKQGQETNKFDDFFMDGGGSGSRGCGGFCVVM